RNVEQLKCSCREFSLYRFICCHTVALAEFETRLFEQLASVGEKLSLESLSGGVEAGKSPDAGLKPGGRRRGHMASAMQQDRTIQQGP
ncbi:MAG: SWIM zinc finger family protein, partial [Gammaproteobacteria bacterium]|nr:SWIM zinc finger family protein [Gammaproteobacteria bacterium]